MSNANPYGCCGIPVGCCPNNLSETLTATFAVLSNCACVAGMQVQLHWNDIDAAWIGTGPGGPACALLNERFRLTCGGSSCQNFTLVGGGNTTCLSTSANPISGCTCDPLNLVFDLTFNGIGCCNSFPGSGSVRVTVTE